MDTAKPETLDDVVLIPRDDIFGNPDRILVKISPDGEHLSRVGPVDGVPNVWVAPSTGLETALATHRPTLRG